MLIVSLFLRCYYNSIFLRGCDVIPWIWTRENHLVLMLVERTDDRKQKRGLVLSHLLSFCQALNGAKMEMMFMYVENYSTGEGTARKR